MQVAESTTSTQVINHGRRCSICDHDGVTAINSLLASATLSNRRIAAQYGFTERAVRNHKDHHLSAKIVRAAEKLEEKASDRFMNHVNFLVDESRQLVIDAKTAEKVVLTGKDQYERMRDIGAMAPAINAAAKVGELYGNATGQLNQGAASPVNVHLSVILPRAVEQQPAIAQGEVIDVAAIEPGEPPKDS